MFVETDDVDATLDDLGSSVPHISQYFIDEWLRNVHAGQAFDLEDEEEELACNLGPSWATVELSSIIWSLAGGASCPVSWLRSAFNSIFRIPQDAHTVAVPTLLNVQIIHIHLSFAMFDDVETEIEELSELSTSPPFLFLKNSLTLGEDLRNPSEDSNLTISLINTHKLLSKFSLSTYMIRWFVIYTRPFWRLMTFSFPW